MTSSPSRLAPQVATSGPWKAVYREDHEWRIDAPKGDKTLGHSRWDGLAVVYGCDDMPVEGAAVAKANAHLIAAAPAMRDALQAMLLAMRKFRPHPFFGDDQNEAFELARRALVSATVATDPALALAHGAAPAGGEGAK